MNRKLFHASVMGIFCVLGALAIGQPGEAKGRQMPGTSILASPGDLDTSFNGIGWTTILSSPSSSALDMTLQPDGKIVAVGYYFDTSLGTDVMLVARYHTDGTLDPSFSGDGMVTTPYNLYLEGNAVDIQGDGKIVVVGTNLNYMEDDITVVRYTSSGILDPTFGMNGIVTTNINPVDAAEAVDIQSDNKIVVAGIFNLLRYTPTGTLDNTFGGGDGIVTTPGIYAKSVLVQSDGKILVGGYQKTDDMGNFALARYTSAGDLDPTFGDGAGFVVTDLGSDDEAYSMRLQGTSIVLAGKTGNRFDDKFAVVRYTSTGSLDPTFSNDGMVATNLSSGPDRAYDVRIQSDNKILLIGQADDSISNYIGIVRYASNGSLDDSFSDDGMLTFSLGGYVLVHAGELQTDNKILVAGCLAYDLFVARFLGDPLDAIPPAAITDLTASTGTTAGSVDLHWTAPGDDGTAGTATQYIIRYSPSIIDTETAWSLATDVLDEPAPAVAGTQQASTVSGLTPGAVYYFAIRSADEVHNLSGLSNSPDVPAGGTFLTPIANDIELYDHLKDSHPCGTPKSPLFEPVPPYVGVDILFSVINPASVKEAYLVADNVLSAHYSLAELATEIPGRYAFDIDVPDVSGTVLKAWSIYGRLMLDEASGGTISAGINLIPSIEFTSQGIFDTYGVVHEIVLVGFDEIEYRYSPVASLRIPTIHDLTWQGEFEAGSLSPRCNTLIHAVYSPADLLVIDSLGRATGTSAGLPVVEIPESYYTGPDAEPEMIIISNPAAGTDFILDLWGTGDGIYTSLSAYLNTYSGLSAGFYTADSPITIGYQETILFPIPFFKLNLPAIVQLYSSTPP